MFSQSITRQNKSHTYIICNLTVVHYKYDKKIYWIWFGLCTNLKKLDFIIMSKTLSIL